MPKYINADQFERDCMFDKNCEDMQDVIYKLRDYPSADVVEVTKCAEIIYSMIDDLKKDFPLLSFNERFMMERGLKMAVFVMQEIFEGIYDEEETRND